LPTVKNFAVYQSISCSWLQSLDWKRRHRIFTHSDYSW